MCDGRRWASASSSTAESFAYVLQASAYAWRIYTSFCVLFSVFCSIVTPHTPAHTNRSIVLFKWPLTPRIVEGIIRAFWYMPLYSYGMDPSYINICFALFRAQLLECVFECARGWGKSDCVNGWGLATRKIQNKFR